MDSAAPGNQTWSYSYGSLDRVTAVTTPYGTVSVGLNDKINRRESLQAGAQSAIAYGFDNDDNITSVTQNGATASLTHDELNRLVQQSLPAPPNPVTTAWAFDNAGFVTSVTSTKNGATLDSHTYQRDAVVTDTIDGVANQTLFGPGTDHALARNGEFFLPNHASSTSGLTDSSGNLTQGYLYGPFGELLNSPTDSNPFQYTGRENDGDGLLYYRARYYCPAWGPFLSSDPTGFDAGINPYVYAHDNPAEEK